MIMMLALTWCDSYMYRGLVSAPSVPVMKQLLNPTSSDESQCMSKLLEWTGPPAPSVIATDGRCCHLLRAPHPRPPPSIRCCTALHTSPVYLHSHSGVTGQRLNPKCCPTTEECVGQITDSGLGTFKDG